MSAPISLQLEAIFLSPGHDFKGRFGQTRLDHGIERVSTVQCHAGRGLFGDRYYDHKPDYKAQATFFAAEVGEALLAEFAPHLRVDAGLERFRRNFLTRGVDLNTLIGHRFRLGSVVFEGVEECAPCFWMDQAIGPGVEAALHGCGGLRTRILCDGEIAVGAQELVFLES